MQRRHEKKQWLHAHLEEIAEVHYIEHVAQKIRKVVEAKTREEAKKRRLEEEKKKKQMEYL